MNDRDSIDASVDEAAFLKKVRADLERTAGGLPSPAHVVPWQPIPADQYRNARATSPFREAMDRAVKKFGGSAMTLTSDQLLGCSRDAALRKFRDYSILVINWSRSGVGDFGCSELKSFLDSRSTWGSHWLVVEKDQLNDLVKGIGGIADVLPDSFFTMTDLHANDKGDPAKALGLRVRPRGVSFMSRLFGRPGR